MWLCLFFWCQILCVCMWFDASQYLNLFLVAEVWVLQKHMQRDSYTLSHDQWIECDLAVKIWEILETQRPSKKVDNLKKQLEMLGWKKFPLTSILNAPCFNNPWLIVFLFSWHQVFFSNKIWCGSMYFFICNYLESKRFWYTNWILTHGVSNVGPRKLEEKLGSKLDGEELLPVVKGPASSFDELIELLSSKMVIKMGSLSKRDKRWGYIYIYTQ